MRVESGGISSGGYGQRGGIWDSADQGQQYGGAQGSLGGQGSSNFSKPKTPAILKVEHDLDVFVESIQEAENRIRRGDTSRDTQELIRNLQEMGPKIADLTIKLKTAGEYETAEKALSSGNKLSTFLDLFNKFQRSGPQALGSMGGQTQIQQGGKPQGAFFDDFNSAGQGQGGQQSVSFDNFNQFGQTTQPQAPPKQTSGGSFWDNPAPVSTGNQASFGQAAQVQQSSGGFFDTHFDSNQTGGNNSSQGGQSSRPTGQTFFDQPFAGSNQGGFAHQQQKNDDINLLGFDPNAAAKSQTGPQRQGGQTSSNSASADLLALGSTAPVVQQPPQQNFNPFGGQQPQGGFGQPVQQGGFQGQAGMSAGFQPRPFGQQQPTGFNAGQAFGGQSQGINPLMYQHMMANHQPLGYGVAGQGQGQAYGAPVPGNNFGASNNILFASDALKSATEKRHDPFSDLTADLV